MCGIIGAIGQHDDYIIKPGVSRMSHRGPDGSGETLVNLGWGRAKVGQTRLSIVDRECIPVPFHFKSLDITIAYNGEIYNWESLRAELSDGVPWETCCDAEVVARAWHTWGEDCLHRFNGMFSFILVDEKQGKVFVARDRAGVKPLYYCRQDDGSLWFASEIKALPVDFSPFLPAEEDVLEFDCLEQTCWDGVFQVPPGHYTVFDRLPEASHEFREWWSLPDEVDESMTWKEAVNSTHELIEDAIRIRRKSEVPVTLMVSGGLDSAIIQAIGNFDILYTMSLVEMPTVEAASLASKGKDLNLITFDKEAFLHVLPDVAYHLDTPATWTAVCQWFLAREITSDGYKIVLSGEGADELFGGYSRYRFLHYMDQAASDPHLEKYEPTKEFLWGRDEEILAALLDRSPNGRSRGVAMDLVRRFAGKGNLVRGMGRLEFYTTMQVLLRMADRMMAAFAMENRSPFLDYKVMELAARMPTKYKITNKESKAVLRAVARRVGVHYNIVEERTKIGFAIPWAAWFPELAHGERGKWNRKGFVKMMRDSWLEAYKDRTGVIQDACDTINYRR